MCFRLREFELCFLFWCFGLDKLRWGQGCCLGEGGVKLGFDGLDVVRSCDLVWIFRWRIAWRWVKIFSYMEILFDGSVTGDPQLCFLHFSAEGDSVLPHMFSLRRRTYQLMALFTVEPIRSIFSFMQVRS